MCPACLSTLLLAAAGVASTGGVAAVILKAIGRKEAAGDSTVKSARETRS